MSNIRVYEKLMPVKMVKIGDFEFDYSCLIDTLYQLSETSPEDSLGYYGVKDYEICDSDTIDNLITLGYAIKYHGERQSTCYKQKDRTSVDELINEIEITDIEDGGVVR